MAFSRIQLGHSVLGVVLGICAASEAFARGGGEYAPVAELGVNFYTGTSGKSLTGAFGYFMNLRAERRKGFFRPHVSLELQSAVGKASVGADEPSASMFGSGFLGGFHLFLFEEARFLPFLGGAGVCTWHFLKLTDPPDGVEAQTQSLSFGYELSAGVDIRPGSSQGNALRIRSAYSAVTSTLAGISGFQLHAFRVTLGMMW